MQGGPFSTTKLAVRGPKPIKKKALCKNINHLASGRRLIRGMGQTVRQTTVSRNAPLVAGYNKGKEVKERLFI